MASVKHKFGETFFISRGRKGDNIPLVALHGGPGGSSEGLRPLLELSSNRKVYIYDQVGGGKSSPTPKRLWNIETFIEELEILVKAWGLSRFHLFGASWGTTLALEYYLRGRKAKGQVASLLFQSPMFDTKDWANDAQILINGLSKKNQKIINYCHEIGATDSKVYKEAVEAFYLKHVLRNKDILRKRMAQHEKLGKEVYAHMWGASEFCPTGSLKRYSRVKSLKQVRCPTLFVCGEYDEARPETARGYAKSIEGAKVKVIKGASHGILTEKPKAMLATVSNFLAGCD